MKQKQISFLQALKNFWAWLTSSNAEQKLLKEAAVRFGDAPLYDKYKEDANVYKWLTYGAHVISMLLSFFFVYGVIYAPLEFAGGKNLMLKAGLITMTILIGFELLKVHQSKRASDGLVAAWKDIFKLKPVSLVLAVALCVASFMMCKEGSEDLLHETMDKTNVIADDSKAQKSAIEAQYKATLDAEVKLLKAELDVIRADKKGYEDKFGKRTWDNDVKKKVHEYADQIKAKEAEIKALKEQNKIEKEAAISEIKTETGAKVEENKGITAIYGKYGFWVSMCIEILLFFGHIAYARVIYKMNPSPTPVEEEPEEEPEPQQKPVAPQKLAPQTEEEEQHDFARGSIFRLQKQFAEGCDSNDDAKADAAQKGLMRWKGLGYDINTGEYTGIVEMGLNEASKGVTPPVTTLLPPVISPEQRVIIIKDSFYLSKYPDVLEAIENGMSIPQAAKHCEISESIVKNVRRDAVKHGIIPPHNQD